MIPGETLGGAAPGPSIEIYTLEKRTMYQCCLGRLWGALPLHPARGIAPGPGFGCCNRKKQAICQCCLWRRWGALPLHPARGIAPGPTIGRSNLKKPSSVPMPLKNEKQAALASDFPILLGNETIVGTRARRHFMPPAGCFASGKTKKWAKEKALAFSLAIFYVFIVPVENLQRFPSASCGKAFICQVNAFANRCPEEKLLWRRVQGLRKPLPRPFPTLRAEKRSFAKSMPSQTGVQRMKSSGAGVRGPQRPLPRLTGYGGAEAPAPSKGTQAFSVLLMISSCIFSSSSPKMAL